MILLRHAKAEAQCLLPMLFMRTGLLLFLSLSSSLLLCLCKVRQRGDESPDCVLLFPPPRRTNSRVGGRKRSPAASCGLFSLHPPGTLNQTQINTNSWHPLLIELAQCYFAFLLPTILIFFPKPTFLKSIANNNSKKTPSRVGMALELLQVKISSGFSSFKIFTRPP